MLKADRKKYIEDLSKPNPPSGVLHLNSNEPSFELKGGVSVCERDGCYKKIENLSYLSNKRKGERQHTLCSRECYLSYEAAVLAWRLK